MKKIKKRFVRAREVADLIGINRKQRIEKSRNKEWELISYFNKVRQRWEKIGFHLPYDLAYDNTEKGVDKYLLDETFSQVLLMEKGINVKNPSEEAKQKYIELQKIKEKSKKLKGKVGEFIKGNVITCKE